MLSWLQFFLVLGLVSGGVSCRDRQPAAKEDGTPAATSEANPATQRGEPESPASSAVATDHDVEEPGFHAHGAGAALAFEPGMSWHAVDAAIEEAIAARLATASGATRQRKALSESQFEVTTREVTPKAGSDVASIRLTAFESRLVSVLVHYREADSKRVLGQVERTGPGVHGSGWVGWWLLDTQHVVQWSPDGSSFEVFDLAVAREVVPDIDTVMLASWRQRYKIPPPWARELVQPAP